MLCERDCDCDLLRDMFGPPFDSDLLADIESETDWLADFERLCDFDWLSDLLIEAETDMDFDMLTETLTGFSVCLRT